MEGRRRYGYGRRIEGLSTGRRGSLSFICVLLRTCDLTVRQAGKIRSVWRWGIRCRHYLYRRICVWLRRICTLRT
jgi:hypothetical protein